MVYIIVYFFLNLNLSYILILINGITIDVLLNGIYYVQIEIVSHMIPDNKLLKFCGYSLMLYTVYILNNTFVFIQNDVPTKCIHRSNTLAGASTIIPIPVPLYTRILFEFANGKYNQIVKFSNFLYILLDFVWAVHIFSDV